MAGVPEGLYAKLSGHSGVSALVSTRIDPIEAPQSYAMPYIVYQIVSEVPYYVHRGETGFMETTFQLTLFASTYLAMTQLCDAVRDCLSGFVGTMTTGVSSMGCFLESYVDVPVFPASGQEMNTYGRRVDGRVLWSKNQPAG